MSAGVTRIGRMQTAGQIAASIAKAKRDACTCWARQQFDDAAEHQRVAEQLEALFERASGRAALRDDAP